MINIFLCIYGQKLLEQLCMYRTVLHIKYSRTRHLKKSSPAEKPEVSHLRIFGCPVYIHISKEKRTKLYPSEKKGVFVGYSESSKAYRIYFLGFKNIDISRDVTFDKDSTYNKSIKRPAEELEETEAPRIHDTTMNE